MFKKIRSKVHKAKQEHKEMKALEKSAYEGAKKRVDKKRKQQRAEAAVQRGIAKAERKGKPMAERVQAFGEKMAQASEAMAGIEMGSGGTGIKTSTAKGGKRTFKDKVNDMNALIGQTNMGGNAGSMDTGFGNIGSGAGNMGMNFGNGNGAGNLGITFGSEPNKQPKKRNTRRNTGR